MTVATPAARTDGALLLAARDGDRRGWEELVDRYSPLLWAIARRHGLSRDDAAEVVRTSWLRCVEHLDRIGDSAGVAAWLVTTCRRESLAARHRSGTAGDPDRTLTAVVIDLEERILLRVGTQPHPER
jgi:DNA-directed RNA polymerase specialized sigma24 family protein